MFFEYSPTYDKRGFPTSKEIKEDTIYYIGYIEDEKLATLPVKVEQLYSETPPYHDGKDRTSWYAKLYVPKSYYKSFLHKWFSAPSITYEYKDKKVNLSFVKSTELEAKIAYLNIMAEPSKSMVDTIDKITIEFADKHPDIFISKIMNYSGIRCSHSPTDELILD